MQDNRFRWASFFGVGPQQEDDMWTEEERRRLRQQSMSGMAQGLLAAGGWSDTPISGAQAMGMGFAGYNQGREQAEQGLMQRRQMTAQQERAKQYQAWLATLPPDMAANLRLLTPEEGAKHYATEQGKVRLEERKAAGRDNRTSLQKEAESMFPGDRARQSAYIQNAREKAGTNVTVGGQPADVPFGKKGQELSATTYFDLQNQAAAAQQGLASIDALESVFSARDTGKIAEAAGKLGQWLGTDAGADYQAADAIVQDRVFEIINALKGPATEKDAERAQAQVPNMGTDPRARRVVFDYIRRKAQAKLRNYQAATEYGNANKTLIGFMPPDAGSYAVGAPSAAGARPERAPQGGLQPGTVEEGYRFLGGDPSDPENWEPI